MNKGKILVVDDDSFCRTICADILTGNGFSVKAVASGKEAISAVKNEDIDIVITDLIMPEVDGMEILTQTKRHNILTDVIVVTGHGSIDSAVEALKNGASDYIRKPLNEDELILCVNSCMEKKKLLEENMDMKQSLKLFEVIRNVSTTLDINKLYSMAVDAMLQIVPGDAGIIFFYKGEPGKEKIDIQATNYVSETAAGNIARLFNETFEKDLKGLESITAVSKGELKAKNPKDLEDIWEFHSFLVIPLLRNSVTVGFMLILNRKGKDLYTIREIKNASFLIEHSRTAFENAYKYAEAKELAFIDSLTNLYNSKYLETALDRELKRSDRLLMPVTVLFLDLDNFKNINDSNDHLVGSRVLVEVAQILLKCVRDVDTVIRYGGDEYVIILVDASYEASLRVADRIRVAIENAHFLQDDSLDIRITASIGVATYPVHTKDKKELLKIADKAMYRAKSISRNVVFLAPLPGVKAN